MEEFRRVTLFRIKDDANGSFAKAGDIEFDRIDLADDDAVVFVKYESASGRQRSDSDIPWLRILNSAAGERRYKFEGRNKFPRATVGITFPAEGCSATYVAAFGLGADALIDRRKLVYDFGIKVAMNICDVDKLRRVQTTAHEAVSRQTERQASVGTNLSVFGVNTEVEFLRMLSGIVASQYRDKIESFRGKESISLKLPKDAVPDMRALAQLCRILEERYKSEDYKSTDLRVYDHLKIENDPIVTDALDALLAEKVEKKDFSHVHLAPPDFIDGEDVQYAYEKRTESYKPPTYDDLRIDELLSVRGRKRKALTAATFRAWDVYRVNDETGVTFRAWSAYRCMVAEITFNDKSYVLSNGKWRQISEELKTKVNKYFEENPIIEKCQYLPDGLSIYDKIKYKLKEEVFNRQVTRHNSDIYLFDRSKSDIAGKKIYEICDLFVKDGTMIHVKRHSSGSASINHVFTQAKLYAHAFSTESATREGMRYWIDNNGEPENEGKDSLAFKAAIPEKNSDVDEREHHQVICILTGTKDMSLSDLPFMTQYELMLAHRYLTHDRKFRASVTFKHVDLAKP